MKKFLLMALLLPVGSAFGMGDNTPCDRFMKLINPALSRGGRFAGKQTNQFRDDFNALHGKDFDASREALIKNNIDADVKSSIFPSRIVSSRLALNDLDSEAATIAFNMHEIRENKKGIAAIGSIFGVLSLPQAIVAGLSKQRNVRYPLIVQSLLIAATGVLALTANKISSANLKRLMEQKEELSKQCIEYHALRVEKEKMVEANQNKGWFAFLR